MKRLLIALMILTCTTSAFAATKQEIRMELRELLLDLDNSQTPIDQLDEVLDLLTQAKRIIRSGDSGPNIECINYIFSKYNQSLNAAVAMDKATNACKTIKDLGILEFSFTKANAGLSAAAAMDLVVPYNTAAIVEKRSIVEFSFYKYNASLSASASIEKSLINSSTINKNRFDCLVAVFPKLNTSLSSAAAMDKSFETCK